MVAGAAAVGIGLAVEAGGAVAGTGAAEESAGGLAPAPTTGLGMTPAGERFLIRRFRAP